LRDSEQEDGLGRLTSRLSAAKLFQHAPAPGKTMRKCSLGHTGTDAAGRFIALDAVHREGSKRALRREHRVRDRERTLHVRERSLHGERARALPGRRLGARAARPARAMHARAAPANAGPLGGACRREVRRFIARGVHARESGGNASAASGALSPVLLVFASHVRLDRGRLRARAPGASRLLRMTTGFSLRPSGSSASLRSAPATVTSFAHWIFYT
jgi:hypothetical protein